MNIEKREPMPKDRNSYTWDDVINDLPLLTPLNLRETAEVVSVLQSSRIHPYDALPPLKEIFLSERSTHIGKAYAVLALMGGARVDRAGAETR